MLVAGKTTTDRQQQT